MDTIYYSFITAFPVALGIFVVFYAPIHWKIGLLVGLLLTLMGCFEETKELLNPLNASCVFTSGMFIWLFYTIKGVFLIIRKIIRKVIA